MRRRTETSTERSAQEASDLRRAPVEADSAFDALLRDAAQVSGVAEPGTTSPLVLGGTLAGARLQVLRYLGRGGMGVVYEVFDAERRSKVCAEAAVPARRRLDLPPQERVPCTRRPDTSEPGPSARALRRGIVGESGIGKSALAETFFEELLAHAIHHRTIVVVGSRMAIQHENDT